MKAAEKIFFKTKGGGFSAAFFAGLTAAGALLPAPICQAQSLLTPDLDYLKGTRLHAKAAGGDEEAMYKLGALYYYGDGKNYRYSPEDGRNIPVRNFKEAFFWFKKSAATGHLDSLYHFGLLNWEEAEGDWRLAELGASREKGLEALKEAAGGGHALAMFELSRFYRGEDRAKEADFWERKAADAGHLPSKYSVHMGGFLSGSGAAREEAVEWFLDFVYKKTGKFGAYAMGHIAEAYSKGIGGLSKDPVKAYAWQSLFVEHYPSCGDSESFRRELLSEYEGGLSSEDVKEALAQAETIKRDIESRSGARLRRPRLDCAD